MKFIKKTDEPQFFSDDTRELREKIKTAPKKSDVWNNDYTKKRALKEHILAHEQNWLCCYCESKVTLDDSHVEHIKPKSLDYDNLTFKYLNLAVSCDGKCHTDGNTPATCGHKKDDGFDEIKFLNPTTAHNIREYFVYTDHGHIGASSLDKEKSKYTLELLKLHTFDNNFDNNLPEARLTALDEFRKSVKKDVEKTHKEMKDVAKILLNKENLAFISFLRFKYKKLLQGVAA